MEDFIVFIIDFYSLQNIILVYEDIVSVVRVMYNNVK